MRRAPVRRTLPGPVVDPFRNERRWALSLICSLALYLRAWDPFFSTAYMDETVYVVYGRMFLARAFEHPLDTPLHHSFGWYLWPAMAAAADGIAGIAGVRELGAVMGTLAVLALYLFARRLFSPEVGLAAAGLFAVLAPPIYASRIATRDAGALGFFAVGLWLFVVAWQDRSRPAWLGSAAALFAAFLCKYLVAIFFPALVILALLRWRQSLVSFVTVLTAGCTAYLLLVGDQLRYLLAYRSAYTSLVAGDDFLQIYVWRRLDVWLLVAFALLAFLWRGRRWVSSGLWLGVLLLLGFQAAFRGDYDYWKHAAYALLFLAPAAAAGGFALTHRLFRGDVVRRVIATAVLLVVLAATSAWAGSSWKIDRFLFWPNVEPVLAWFDGKLLGSQQVLVDDSVFRYYFHPPLHQWQIADPFYFEYQGANGPAAYAAAVGDGAFDYIVLDGGMGAEARVMTEAIAPVLATQYELRLAMPDSILGHSIRIYARRDPAPELPPSPAVRISIAFPNSQFAASQPAQQLTGSTVGAWPGWKVRAEVFTDRWHYQGESRVHVDGSYAVPIHLGGQGPQQCNHLVRARLVDQHGRTQATATVFGVIRSNPDGSLPGCAVHS